MKYISDPITQLLSRYIWLFWAILWTSVILAIGSDPFTGYNYMSSPYEVSGLIANILLWGAVIVQAIKVIYYTEKYNNLIKLGRWLLLVATGIFAFRMSYMLVIYGTVYSSLATTIGASILALGLIFSSLGVMMDVHFDSEK